MEVLKLQKTEIEKTYGDCRNLREIVDRLEVKLQQHGQVICRLHVNGLSFSEQDEERFAQTQVNDISELTIESEVVKDVISGSVRSLIEFIAQLKETCVDDADRFRSGNITEAQSLFANVMRNTQWLIGALQALEPQMDVQNLRLKDMWRTNETHMVHTARELMEAYELGDFVLLSDVLEYELYTSLDKWRDCLVAFSAAAPG